MKAGKTIQKEMRLGPNHRHGIARRIARYLDWAAWHSPGRIISFEKIAQSVLDLYTPPRAGSDLTRRIQEFAYKARPILLRDYGRDLITAPGRGAMATATPTDAVVFGLARDINRLRIAMRAARRTHRAITQGKIDAKSLPTPLVEWLEECDGALQRGYFRIVNLNGQLRLAAEDTRQEITKDTQLELKAAA